MNINININSWHYKWYKFTYYFFDGDPPANSNLCQYVRRMFWLTPVIISGFILGAFFIVLGLVLYYLIITPVLFLFGFKPINVISKLPKDAGQSVFPPYRGLWGVLYPWQLIAFGVIVWSEKYLWTQHFHATLIWHLASVSGIVFLSSFLYLWFDDSESVKLFRAWLTAKKNKVCPLVSFTDQQSSD